MTNNQTPPPSKWTQMLLQNPGHSQWYIDRFDQMSAEGRDLLGEARFVDTLARRGARIVDLGCGPGRHGGYLASLGHDIHGVDGDERLIEVARERYPNATWTHQDLAVLDLDVEPFEIGYCVGNVLTFLNDSTRDDVLARFKRHLQPGGRLVTGHQPHRGWSPEDLTSQLEAVGFKIDYLFGTWDMKPITPESDFCIVLATA